MDRRRFLKSILVGVSFLSLELLLPKRLSAKDNSVKDFFDYYAENTGLNEVRSLTQSNRAGRLRQQINEAMARNGYLYNHHGELYQDYTNVRDLAKYIAPFDDARDVESYVVMKDNLFDISVPFYPNYAPGTRIVSMLSLQLIGAALAVANYRRDNSLADTSELRDIFVPRAVINNPISDTISEDTLAVYGTRNGELSVQSRRNGSRINLLVEATGDIEVYEDFLISLD